MNPALHFIRHVGRASLLSFEGVQVRSDALEILEAASDRTMTVKQLAQERERSPGGTAKVVAHYVESGLLETIELMATYAPAKGARWGYCTTEKGARLLAAVRESGDELNAAGDWPPRPDPSTVVASALATQPRSIFDLGRLLTMPEPPPKVAEPQRMPANSVWALAA